MSDLRDLRELFWSLGLSAAAILLAFAVQRIISAFGQQALRRSSSVFFKVWVGYAVDSTRYVLPLVALLTVAPWLRLQPAILTPLTHAVGLALIGIVGWRTIRMIGAFETYIAIRHPVAKRDLIARQLGTQVQVLRHIATVVIIVLTVSIMLLDLSGPHLE